MDLVIDDGNKESNICEASAEISGALQSQTKFINNFPQIGGDPGLTCGCLNLRSGHMLPLST